MKCSFENILKQDYDCHVIIWGTKTAGQICYRLLRELQIQIMAVGDNNIQMIGKNFNGIPVLSLPQIQSLYPEALIVVGSFLHDVSETIITQLKSSSERFTFCRFEQIEYLYEIKYLKRKIQDKEKLYQIINHISQDKEKSWVRRLSKNVMSEYRYRVRDSQAVDLKSMLSQIYGVKNLSLIVNREKVEEAAELVEELSGYDNIGHIIMVVEKESEVYQNVLKRIVDKVFYAICDETADRCCLEETGFIVEFKKVTEGLFSYGNRSKSIELTEERIVHSVLMYVNGKKGRCEFINDKRGLSVHIVQLFNGLANQMLMYLFGRYLEEESKHIVIFDDTILSLDIFDEDENIKRISKWNKSTSTEDIQKMVKATREKNSFYHFKRAEVAEVFDIPIRLLSDYFDEETWRIYLFKVKKEFSCKYAQSFPLGQLLLESGIDINVVRDCILPDEFLSVNSCYCIDTYGVEKPYERYSVTDFLMHNKENTYYMGIWATGKREDWLLNNRKWAREQFQFRLNLDERNKYYEEEIIHADGVMLHVRRGDFVYAKMSADADYYKKSIQAVEELYEYKNKKYFIFSEDLSWCQKHERELGLDKVRSRVLYIVGNTGIHSYIDMYLMSLGKICIPTPISSFSYVAALISETMEKCIDIPRYLYSGEVEVNELR